MRCVPVKMGLLWAVVFLSAVTTISAQRYYVVAPNVFRMNVEETVSVYVASACQVELYLQAPGRAEQISKIVDNFQPGAPKIVKMKITDKNLQNNFGADKMYFNLVVKAPGFNKVAPILVNLKGGTVFIQTDKPIYSPGEKVNYRIIPVGVDMLPMKEKVMVEIMNPQGIRILRERNIEAWKEGFKEKSLKIGKLPVLGTWTITAYHGFQNQANSSTTFVVKEYVLPTFNVEIQPPPYIAEMRRRMAVKVTAKYSFGKLVAGTLRIQMIVVYKDGREIEVEDRWLPITGESISTMAVQKLVGPKDIPSFPVGQRLKIKAEVSETATGTKIKAKPVFVDIVKSPFTVTFERTPKYFKPSVSFRVMVAVRYPNKMPVSNLQVKFEATDGKGALHMERDSSNAAKTDSRGEAFFTFAAPPNVDQNARITCTVKTNHKNVLNTESKLILEPYISNSGNYIIIRPPLHKPKISNRISISFLVSSSTARSGVNQLNYLFLSRGKIVKSGVIQKEIGTETPLDLPVTAEMAPKCRIVAFFVKNGEMVSDSVLMDIENGYKNDVLLNTDPSPDTTFTPAKDFQIKLKASSKSVIGLLAVDQSVYYLRNESRVTHKKVFEDMGSFDLGCGQGSGRNNKDVLDRAGLSVLTDVAVPVSRRADLSCQVGSKRRKRRSATDIIRPLKDKCCIGLCCQELVSAAHLFTKRIKCNELQKYLPSVCWSDFYSCCVKNFAARGRSLGDRDEFVPNVDDISEDASQMTIRQFFPESWMWVKDTTNDDGSFSESYTLPDSITTWELSAVAINNQTGFGLSNAVNIVSRRNVFIHLKLPPSVQRYEQITVYAVIYNFNPMKTRVNLFFMGHASFCSIAKPGARSERISIVIDGNDAVAIPFTVIPLQVGEIPIDVLAFTLEASDRIIKNLRVVPEGAQDTRVFSVVLDPKGIMDGSGAKNNEEVKQDGVQLNTVNLTLPENIVPGSLRVMIYVTGNLMSPSVKDIIENGLEGMIRMPVGCGEQTMMTMAPLVYVMKYLYSIKNGVTEKVESKAYNFMRAGYRNELKFRRNDNSYSVWGQRTKPMTWLSAFVNKVFCQATDYIEDDIDGRLICSTSKFLEGRQAADGSFIEAMNVYHREMRGEVDNKVALTAFVVISLVECNPQCAGSDSTVLSKASKFLEAKVPSIKAGNLMSIVAYALALSGSSGRMNAYNKMVEMLKKESKNGRNIAYIADGGLASQVEATSYALLTMMAMKKVREAGPLVVWLTSMRNARGVFISTQDTVIALQALSEYTSKAPAGEMDLRISVDAVKSEKKIFHIQKGDMLVRKEADLTNAYPGLILIETKGTGVAQLQVEATFNLPSADTNCEYEIEVTTREDISNIINDEGIPVKPIKNKKKKNKKNRKRRRRRCKGKKKKSKKCDKKTKKQQGDEVPNNIKIRVCARHKFNNGSVMTMVEVGLLTGFKADNDSLRNLIENVQPKIYKYEVSDQNVVFYLEKVTTVKSCFQFTMVKSFKVGALQAVPVKVYDYYEPGKVCKSFYRPKKNSALLDLICEDGDQCECSQGGCPAVQNTNPKKVKKFACLKSDNVFIADVRGIVDENSAQKVILRVTKVYKGSQGLTAGLKVHMYKRTSCDHPDLKTGQQYLIMVKQSPVYQMNEDAFILEWPTSNTVATKLQKALQEVKNGAVCDFLTE